MKSTADLPPDEVYVVTQLRATPDMSLRTDVPGLLRVGALPVCTFDTLFRMLGRGVLTLDPTASRADRYELTADWKG